MRWERRSEERELRAQRIGVRAREHGVDALHAEVGAPDAAEDHRGAHHADEGDGLVEDDEARDHRNDGDEEEEVPDLLCARLPGGALPEQRAQRRGTHGEEDEQGGRDRIRERLDGSRVLHQVEGHDGNETPAEGLAGHEDRAVLVHALEERRVARPGERGTERQIKARCGKLLDHVVVEPDEAHAGRHRHDPELRHPVQPEAVVERNHDEGREERRGGHDGRDGARVRLLQRQILKPVVERNAGDAEKRELRLVDQLVGKELLVGENQKHRVGEEGAERQNRKRTEVVRVEPFGRNVGEAPGENRDKREKKAR